jgi:phenylpropionate dioxygenase-like ring-hydroxylating dioxygenase large terminal subunit
VTRKERSSSTILGCRYHGWSYDTKGQLTKAPEFDSVPDFDKKKNGLWEIHVNINVQGLVFVNLDAGETISNLSLGKLEAGIKYFDMSQMKRVAEWHHEANFNWKIGSQ